MAAATRRQAATKPPRWVRFLARRNVGTGHRIEFEIIITKILAVGRQPTAIGYDFNMKYRKIIPIVVSGNANCVHFQKDGGQFSFSVRRSE
jgi:hypothetical protein